MSDTKERMLTCPVCGAGKWIQNAWLRDSDFGFSKEVGVSGKRLTRFGDLVDTYASSAPQVKVCGECGYIALFAENPTLLWETFCKIGR